MTHHTEATTFTMTPIMSEKTSTSLPGVGRRPILGAAQKAFQRLAAKAPHGLQDGLLSLLVAYGTNIMRGSIIAHRSLVRLRLRSISYIG